MQTTEKKRGRGKGIMLPNLRTHRERHAWTLRKLQEESGVDASLISKIERGQGAQPKTINRLAGALGVTPADLVG
ncbi:MAG: helix-turn-helix transcriptional regulator [Actinomycetota bacterium]|jgi:transcriptional regulator with XRE-family HTH domain|nr:helix-turn-helix transcriptional regulator [Actinomycetota bacterium]